MKMDIIGLTGYASSGKSTASEFFVKNGYHHTKMARPLKNMLRSLYKDLYFEDEDIERMIEGDFKQSCFKMLQDRSPRTMMQTLGTEWGRNLIGENFWVDAWITDIRRNKFDKVVVDDIRFDNEAEAIRNHGGIIIEIQRPGVGALNAHRSESVMAGDYVVQNDGSLHDLRYKLRNYI